MEEMDSVYRRHAQTVYKFLLAQCHDPDLAEELTQETFCQAVRSVDRFDGRCRISTWLCQIARHLWYAHLRRRDRELPLEDAALPAVPSAEEAHLADQDRMDLLRRIHALPEPGREVLYLRLFGGLTFREIGSVLGKTENWARVTFYRCKETLRKGATEDEN